MKLTIDFETLSAVVDLPKTGVWPYAEHPSTDIFCLSIRERTDFGAPIEWVWVPEWVLDILGSEYGIENDRYNGRRLCGALYANKEKVIELINAAEEIEAHNSEFERALWYYVMHIRYGFPDLPFFKVRCSAAKAAMHGLPRALAKACEALGLPERKDKSGSALINKLSKPRAPRKAEWARMAAKYQGNKFFTGLKDAYDTATKDKLKAMCAYAAANWAECKDMLLWHRDPEDIAAFIRYCNQDTKAEEGLSEVLDPLPESELRYWQHDQIVNMRGVPIDLDMVEAAIGLAAEHEVRLLGEMEKLTDGKVRSPRQVQVGTQWLHDQGVFLDNLQKATVSEALGRDDLPDKARRFLEIRQTLSRSSVAKYEAARVMACSDGRIRGIAMYHGAGTGRFTHKGMQVGNLPKGIFKTDEAIANAVRLIKARNLDALIFECGDPMEILSSAIRSVIYSGENNIFNCADFSAIEGRGIAWLAGEQWVLDVYEAYDRGEGCDMYEVTAAKILGKRPEDITPEERKSPGKIANLACGFGGGQEAIRIFGGKCPEVDRTTVIDEFMYSRIPEDNQEARQFFRNTVQPGFSSEEEYRALAQYGYVTPTEEDIFETWARDVVTKWRKAHPNIVALWRGLESAAIEAVQRGRGEYRGIVYENGEKFLTCLLPSGRKLYYPFPQLQNRTMPWGQVKLCLSHMNVDGTTKQWVRRFVHGSFLSENVTQAVCRDLLVDAMYRLELNGFPIVMHVHDEAVAEVSRDSSNLDLFIATMSEVPAWAKGFPIAAAGWVGDRFKKD